MQISSEVIEKFYSIYQDNPENLKKIPPALIEMGLGYMDIFLLTRQELKLGIREAILLLEIPDTLQ